MIRTRRILARCLPVVGALAVLSGCVHPVQDTDSFRPAVLKETAGAQPANTGGGSPALVADANGTIPVEVSVFQGGYGIDFFEKAAQEYEAAHPGVKIHLKGDPRIWEQLRPRFVAGEPPSLTFPGWGMDHYALIYEHQARPLDDALLTSAYGESTGTWRDTFLPELLKLGEYQGLTYMLPFYVSLNGWWYNVDLFEKNGWQPPKTYSELLELCAKIKAKNIAPLTYQGKYPYYALGGFIFPWAISAGGIQAYRDAESLKPGAWKSAALLKAAQMVAELREKGYFQNGANGMSHTESQMEFLQGRAAMIPCGTWLESEMKKQMPPGFRMAFFLPPQVDGGKGDPTAVQVGVEPWMVPTKGQNSALAIDFFKYMTSRKKAREFVLAKGTVTAIKGSDSGELPPTLRAPAAVLRGAKTTWTNQYAKWYKSLDDATQTAMGSLLQGTMTPQQFVDASEAAAEKVRRDPNIPKH